MTQETRGGEQGHEGTRKRVSKSASRQVTGSASRRVSQPANEPAGGHPQIDVKFSASQKQPHPLHSE